MLSKSIFWYSDQIPKIESLNFTAGHFSPKRLYPEHGLIFNNIIGQSFKVLKYSQGKRGKKTITLEATITAKKIYQVVNKFINIVLAVVRDLRSPKRVNKGKNLLMFDWRFRKMFEWYDIRKLITNRVLPRNKPFLPLCFSVNFNKGFKRPDGELYLRMLRFPAIYYKRFRPKTKDSYSN